MEKELSRKTNRYMLLATFVIGGMLLCLLYEVLRINALSHKVETLTENLASSTLFFSKNTRELSKNLTDLNNQTTGLVSTLSTTQKNIDSVKTQVGGVAQTVGTIKGTVGDLQKLSQTDPELLKKYSKVYFLSENYTPAHLAVIPPEYTYSTQKTEQFLTEVLPKLKNIIDDAHSSGVNLYVKSAYRSFREQKALKSSYSVTYGAGTANAFSADQGYSEHQLGTTVDFISTGLGGSLSGFETTAAYTWLLANGYRYGFVLSYPKGNNYYVYEPWHWRYVGIKLATYLHDHNVHFYDVDQREIDTYLLTLFD